MKFFLLKPLLVMAVALLLVSVIANTTPTDSTQKNIQSFEHKANTELTQLNLFIAGTKADARSKFVELSMKKHSQSNPSSKRTAKTYYGIDVSHYQGDLLSVMRDNSHLSFVITKASNGSNEVDPMFYKNWQLIKKEGYMRGSYHFYMASDSPEKQARHFINTVGSWENNDMAPIVDIEKAGITKGTESKQLQQDIIRFLTYLEVHTKKLPMIYSNTAFAQQWLNNKEFARYPLWLADYSKEKKPTIPKAWQQQGALIWQRSDTYKIDSTYVDFDVFHGQLSQLTGE